VRSKCLDVSEQADGSVNEELLMQLCSVYRIPLELTAAVCLDAVRPGGCASVGTAPPCLLRGAKFRLRE
jgi:hypothetical protein